MTRKVGLAALTVLELSPQEQVSLAAQAGYDFVGLRLIPVAGQPHQHAVDAAAIEKRLADTGMKVLDVEVFRLDSDTRVADFEPMLAISQRLGASDLLVHGADPDSARLADSWGRLCDLAGRYGLAANLEPMPWVEISTIAKANRLLASAPRTNAAVLRRRDPFLPRSQRPRRAGEDQDRATCSSATRGARSRPAWTRSSARRARTGCCRATAASTCAGCSARCRPIFRSASRSPTRGRCRRWNARGSRSRRAAVPLRMARPSGASSPAIAPMAARRC